MSSAPPAARRLSTVTRRSTRGDRRVGPSGFDPGSVGGRGPPLLGRPHGIFLNPRISRSRSKENAVSIDSRFMRTPVVQSVWETPEDTWRPNLGRASSPLLPPIEDLIHLRGVRLLAALEPPAWVEQGIPR